MTDRTKADGIRERWGQQLRDARVIRRLTQAEVGAAIGVQGQTVSRAETGDRGSLDIYHQLAAHLGVTLEAGDGT